MSVKKKTKKKKNAAFGILGKSFHVFFFCFFFFFLYGQVEGYAYSVLSGKKCGGAYRNRGAWRGEYGS